MLSSVSSNIQNQQKDEPPHRETIDLNVFFSGDEGPVNNADTQNVDSVGNSERQTSEPPEEVSSRKETVDLTALS